MELRVTYIRYLQCCSSEMKVRIAVYVASIGKKIG